MVWYGAMMRWYHFLVFGAMVNGGHPASLPSPQSVAKYKLPQSAKASFSSGRFVSWFIFITTDITMCLFVLFLCEELPNYFPQSVSRKYEYQYSTVQICATNWQIWATSIELDFENILQVSKLTIWKMFPINLLPAGLHQQLVALGEVLAAPPTSLVGTQGTWMGCLQHMMLLGIHLGTPMLEYRT